MTTGSARLAAVMACVAAFTGVALAQSEIPPSTHQIVRFEKVSSDQPGGTLELPDSGCVLVNNVWDTSMTPDGFSQSIFVERHGEKMLPGWNWNAPGTRSTVLSMPEVVCGDKPWDAPLKLRSEFPFHPGEARLRADFDVGLQAQGRHNMAFSLWAVSKLPAVKQNIALEIMIWNVDSGMPHAGTRTGSFEAGGTTFDVYVKNDQGVVTGPDPFTWRLVMFVARAPILKGSIEFSPFIDYLLDRQFLSRDHYLTSLELGMEVIEGAGRVEVRKLDLDTR
jgi:hypothetical protein